MKRLLALLLALSLFFTLFGCDSFKSVADSFKTDESTHNRDQDDKDPEETTENLNYKVIDTTGEESDKTTDNKDDKKQTQSDKTTNKSSATTPKNKNDDEKETKYPNVNVNDGDTTKYEWPKEGIAAEIPELKSGTMKKPFISDSKFSVYYFEVVPEEFDAYLETLKKKGYKIDKTTDEYVYLANNGKIEIEFFYDTSKFGNNSLSLVARYL